MTLNLLLLGGGFLLGRRFCLWLGRSSLLLGSSLFSGGLGLLNWSLFDDLLLGGSLWFLGLGSLLGLGGLRLGLLGGELEGSSALLSGGSSSDNRLGVDQLLESDPHTAGGLGSVHLVVGADVLQDGLAGGTLLVSESLDGSLDHAGVGGVGGGGLGLGSSLLGSRSSGGGSHDEGVGV